MRCDLVLVEDDWRTYPFGLAIEVDLGANSRNVRPEDALREILAAGRCRPKLGWCWDRNPHSWLGAASCLRRAIGDVAPSRNVQP